MDIEFSILSYNIHKGVALLPSYVLSEIREVLRHTKVDMVFLQEVCGQDQRNARQFEFLADSVWHHHAYGKNAVYDGGDHGNAILSAYPILQTDNLDLTLHSWEYRGLLHAIIDLGETHLDLFCTHLNLLGVHRHQQLDQIILHIKKHLGENKPFVLAGDFNDWNNELTERFETELGAKEAFHFLHGEPAKTFPSFFPKLSLDRIYFRGLELLSCEIPNGHPYARLSDHLPLQARFRLGTGK